MAVLCGRSKMGCISVSASPCKYPNFSATLAIWISFGLQCCTNTFTTKRGTSPDTTMPSKHTQNSLVFAIMKKALHKFSYTDQFYLLSRDLMHSSYWVNLESSYIAESSYFGLWPRITCETVHMLVSQQKPMSKS